MVDDDPNGQGIDNDFAMLLLTMIGESLLTIQPSMAQITIAQGGSERSQESFQEC